MSGAAETEAQPFSARAVLLMLLVGVFSFAAFVVLSAYAPDLKSGADGRGHALSKSAIGFAGLVRLAKDAGLPVIVSRGAGPTRGLRILTLEPGMSLKADVLTPKDFTGATLVVAPKWFAPTYPLRPGWVFNGGAAPAKAIYSALPPLPDPLQIVRRGDVYRPVVRVRGYLPDSPIAVGAVDQLQAAAGAQWRAILIDQAGAALLVQSAKSPNLYVLADPDLLDNQGLRDLGRARAAIGILDALRRGGPVSFDVTINGFERSRGVLKLAFEPPFLAATLCAAAAALLMGLHAAVRFGAPRPADRALALGKRGLADNSAALLRLAKREPAMAAPYADLVRHAVARAVAAPRTLGKAELDALLDRLAVKAGRSPVAAALTGEAAAVSDTAGLMTVARKLYDFRRGMTRERD